MRKISEVEEQLPSHQSSFLWTSILPLSHPCWPERGALPDRPFSCSSSVQRKWIWGSQLDGGMEEEERSTGSFSIFLHVTVLGKTAYIFLLSSVKIIHYTSKGMSLQKGSGSCGLFNQLLTTCGSILDENRTAFSSNSSVEFYFSQSSDSIIHPAPRTKGFAWYKDILFSINKHGTTPFSDGIKNEQTSVPEDHCYFIKSEGRRGVRLDRCLCQKINWSRRLKA